MIFPAVKLHCATRGSLIWVRAGLCLLGLSCYLSNHGHPRVQSTRIPRETWGVPPSGWTFAKHNYINKWVNYNDLTATSLGIMVSKGHHPQMALIQVSELL